MKRWIIDHGLPIVLAIACGIFGTLYTQSRDTATSLAGKVTKAEAAAREAIQARYRAEESVDDLKDAAETSKALAVWEVQQKLNACEKAAK
jgi:hypothetical protein